MPYRDSCKPTPSAAAGTRRRGFLPAGQRGFTLVEMMVAMGIFVVVLVMSARAFEATLKGAGRQMKETQSNFEGIVGLETLRFDIEHAGYGLPWSLQFPLPGVFQETTVTSLAGVDPSAFNEMVPSAIRSATAAAGNNAGMHYLVIKSQAAALNDTTKKWCYVNYSSSGATNKSYLRTVSSGRTSNPDANLLPQEGVIVMNPVFSTQGVLTDRQLRMESSTAFSFPVPASGTEVPAAYQPGDPSQHFLAYGISPSASVIMPYNRTDYYVNLGDSKLPQSCNQGSGFPGTGILYKRVYQQNGSILDYPLMNCVGDLQVDYQLGASTWTPNLLGMTPEAIRGVVAGVPSQLTGVQVYILAHEGGKDSNFVYPADSILVGDQGDSRNPGRPSSGRTLHGSDMQARFGPDWKHYRWKVYVVAARPKNLN